MQGDESGKTKTVTNSAGQGSGFAPVGTSLTMAAVINDKISLEIEQAKETFNDKTIEKLDKILTVQHLGVDAEDVVTDINENPDRLFLR